MEVGQITMIPEVAKRNYLAYRNLLDSQRTSCDREIQRSYLELSRGHSILNATEAMKLAGFNEDDSPKLAFAKASWRSVRCQQSGDNIHFTDIDSSPYYTKNTEKGSLLTLYADEFRLEPYYRPDLTTLVPDIPPAHRPIGSLDRYWICWEVEDWKQVPVDPLLLKRLNATTFSVLATWDLTEVERMVLMGRNP